MYFNRTTLQTGYVLYILINMVSLYIDIYFKLFINFSVNTLQLLNLDLNKLI